MKPGSMLLIPFYYVEKKLSEQLNGRALAAAEKKTTILFL